MQASMSLTSVRENQMYSNTLLFLPHCSLEENDQMHSKQSCAASPAHMPFPKAVSVSYKGMQEIFYCTRVGNHTKLISKNTTNLMFHLLIHLGSSGNL